jgi:deoxycytidylate deaminase
MGIPSGERLDICRALHAEQNALLQAALHGVSVAGGTVYVTVQPCFTCAKMIINAGIQRVVCAQSYPDELARSFLAEAGIELVLWEPEPQSDASHTAKESGAPYQYMDPMSRQQEECHECRSEVDPPAASEGGGSSGRRP